MITSLSTNCSRTSPIFLKSNRNLAWLLLQNSRNLTDLATIMSIPAVIIFLIFQRTLLDRMMFGSINE